MFNLVEALREIMKNHELNNKIDLKVITLDGKVITGPYGGFTQALDNEPEIASICIEKIGYGIEIYENEIKSIEVYPTIKIILKSELVDFLLDLLENEKEQYIDIVDDTAIDLNNIKNIIIRSKQEKDGNIYFEIDSINKTRLLQYVMDKQLAIGFVNQDYLNEDGRKLQFIYDEIYHQTN